MNQSASSPRLTRGAHDPKAFAYNIVGLFSQIIPLIAYIGRTLNDTMCDHSDPDICDRCQKRLMTFGTLISGSASAVSSWTPAKLAALHARLAIAAARRLVDVVELGHPVAWAMKGGSVLTAARRAINTATALLDKMDGGSEYTNPVEASSAAAECQTLDLSTSRVARQQGLVEESFIIGHLLKAASKAAEAAVVASNALMTVAGSEASAKYAQTAEYCAGAAVGAALDGAALLDIDPGRAESMMAVATGVVAEVDRRARPAEATPTHREYVAMHGDACEKSTSQKATPGASCSERTTVDRVGYGCVNLDEDHVEHVTALGASWWTPSEPAALPAWLETPTEEYDIVDDFEESQVADAADEAIAELGRAEAILNAIAEEHRAVEQVVRTSRDDARDGGRVTEYFQKCCVVCRDAKGRPMPAPCRTVVILQGYGEV